MGFWDKVKEAVTGESVRRPAETVTTSGASRTPVPEPAPGATSPAGTDVDSGSDGERRGTEPDPADSNSGHRTYTVRSGDTLNEIGAKFGVAGSDIASLNRIKNPELIYPGQVFKIPSR